MSSGSDNSILGYGNIVPNSNINGSFVNKMNSNYAGNFSSNEIPYSGLYASKNNIAAAAGIVPKPCFWNAFKGGSKKLKKKIKNISKMYKMGGKSFKKRVHTMKKKIRSNLKKGGSKYRKSIILGGKKKIILGGTKKINKKIFKLASTRNVGRSMALARSSSFYGGSGIANTPSYSLANTTLKSSDLALANPPPFQVMNNCKDNYNHFTGESS